jgi:hypothetical protein
MLAELAAAVPEQRVTAVELVGLARSADAVLAAGAAGDSPPRGSRRPGPP